MLQQALFILYIASSPSDYDITHSRAVYAFESLAACEASSNGINAVSEEIYSFCLASNEEIDI